MSRLYRNHVAAQQRAPEVIAEIERRFARPDYDTVKHFQNAYDMHKYKKPWPERATPTRANTPE